MYKYTWMLKIDSEVVSILYAIKFDGLSAIDLCINKGYIKQTFCFGFSGGYSVLSQQKSLSIFGWFQSGT